MRGDRDGGRECQFPIMALTRELADCLRYPSGASLWFSLCLLHQEIGDSQVSSISRMHQNL